MFLRITLSFLIYVLVQLPASLIAWPCLAVALLTKWDGRTFFFGNEKWGRATNHYLAPTQGKYWKELLWMGWRNPVYNLGKRSLAVNMKAYSYTGDSGIGDKLRGGFYAVEMGDAWEYYYIKPYVIFGYRRCIRARIGWKIMNNETASAEFAFSINLWKEYAGA